MRDLHLNLTYALSRFQLLVSFGLIFKKKKKKKKRLQSLPKNFPAGCWHTLRSCCFRWRGAFCRRFTSPRALTLMHCVCLFYAG